jgi:hypothetical protein
MRTQRVEFVSRPAAEALMIVKFGLVHAEQLDLS